MRRWVKRLAAGTAALAAIAAVAGAIFLARPGVFLTDRAAAVALTYFGSEWSPRWSSLRLSADALEWRRHRYILSATDFCLDERRGAFSGCFPEFELSVVVRYTRRGPTLESVDHVVAVAKSARLDLRRFKPSKEGSFKPLSLPSVRALHVELPRFEFQSSKTTVVGGLSVILASGPRPLFLKADVRIRGQAGARRLKAAIIADTDLLNGGGAPTYVDLRARADLSALGWSQAAFRVRRESGQYVGSGNVEIFASTGPLRSLRVTGCRGTARSSGGELACRYELLPRKPLPATLGVRALAGRVSLSAGLKDRRYRGALKVDLDPIAAWYKLAADLAVRVEGRLDRPFKDASVRHELHVAAKVPRFEDLVGFLRETKYAVPAPIHVLKGPLSFVIDSRGDPRAARATARYAFSSDLAAGRQRLILRANGGVAAVRARGRSFEHEGTLLFKEVALELPHIDIGRTTKIVYDKRIRTDESPPGASSASWRAAGVLPLRARLLLKTEKPLILFSNLVKDPVPVALDLAATFPPGAASGTVSVRRFEVELFRRDAALEHLNVALSSGSKVGALEGLVSYKTPKAAISILILGTTEKPRIELTSVPPMKREDIIALLIFGKSPDDLDPEQAASVSNTETGLASRAFGLASLYLFGATPIERVGYDPATKTTSVSFRLPGGANLTVGSDFDQSRQLSVRKPLAPHWAIQSEISDQGQKSKAVATFLEWFQRY